MLDYRNQSTEVRETDFILSDYRYMMLRKVRKYVQWYTFESKRRQRYNAIIVTILDTKTGKTKTIREWSYFWWSEGNGSCDCNRELQFTNHFNPNQNCLGCERYLIIKTSEGSLLELNDEYPTALIRKYIKP